MNRSAARIILSAVLLGAGGCSANSSKNPSNASGQQHYQLLNGSTSDASSRAFAAAAADPKFTADTRFAAGQLAESENRFDAATVQYEDALKISPQHVPSLYRLGIVYTRTKKFDKAIAIWNRYIKATNDAASSYSNLGFCYEYAGDYKNAEKAYQQGITRDPKNVACRTKYGLMLARHHRIVDAKAQLSVVLPPDQVAYDLGRVYQQQGNHSAARESFQQALQLNPRNPDAKARLAALPDK